MTWLTGEMDRRGWSNSELARRAEIVPSTVTRIISEQSQPGLDFCVGIARAFKLPPEQVLRLAGLLPPLPAPDSDPALGELLETAKRLNRDERKRLARVALLYLQEQQAVYNSQPHEGDKPDQTVLSTT